MVNKLLLFILELYFKKQPPKLRLRMHAKRLIRRLAVKFNLYQNPSVKRCDKLIGKYHNLLVKSKKLSANASWFSQSGQDLFALSSLPEAKRLGTYLEIGSYLPFKNNNTALLEMHGWSGISVEKLNEVVTVFNKERKNKATCADALTLDYESICKPFHLHFNYCSIDIDPAVNSYFVLKRIIESGVTFDSLTFEHDKYRDGPLVQLASVLLLKRIGMIRVEKNVIAVGFGSFEDWWKSSKQYM